MISVYDIAYVTYQVPDLDRTEAFLTDFGLHRAAREDGRLYMRAAGSAPYVYVAVQGETAKLLGIAFQVRDPAALDEAATLPGASAVEAIPGPGGGRRVRLTGPAGYAIELVHGMATVEPLPLRAPFACNFGSRPERPNTVIRAGRGPTDVLRISHVALYVPDVEQALTWFTQTLGFIVSDRVETPDGGLAGVFTRCDKGAELCDHHVLALVGDAKGTIHHVSFWVEDFDALHIGHDWLTRAGHRHEFGIGRHTLGSQVFDYWRDPDGFLLERYTDGDVFDNTRAPERVPASMEAFFQWGADPQPSFF